MKPKDTPKQYVIYSRKSKFTGKGESIENQIELCRQYIAMHFGEDASENVLVYEDEGLFRRQSRAPAVQENDEGLAEDRVCGHCCLPLRPDQPQHR